MGVIINGKLSLTLKKVKKIKKIKNKLAKNAAIK